MKLNIQYLQRIKEQGVENFGEYFDRVSKTLIENIDVLSMIASSFSDFAMMPKINNEILDLSERLKDAVALFEKTTKIIIELNLLIDEPVQILADKDQFNRALINLIKNSIQAIPREKDGRLFIELRKDAQSALLKITDNGSGIPPELQKKLFEPSFTTKSSGMGLGLAITKRIIENFNGKIWFETKANVGTTFYINIPLYDQDKSI
jgi:signal transduction histidine kinase